MTIADVLIGVLAGVAVGAILGVLMTLFQQNRQADAMSERWRNENERDRGKS